MMIETLQNQVLNKYYVAVNSRGDVERIYNSSKALVAQYSYDSWVKVISVLDGNGNGNTPTSSTHIANLNPIRYRGYYYDSETGFYYLQSRYYDPNVQRFINSDEISVVTSTLDQITDKNLYTYCDNNPILRTDTSGLFWDVVFDVIDVVVSCFCGAGEVVKGAKGINKAADAVDEVYDSAKAMSNATSCPLACFVAGTKILTDKGLVNIEDINVRDLVLTTNIDTNEHGIKEVKKVFEKK